MQNIPVFPTTWNCGWPHEFIGRFQVEDWMKRGMPYMTEEGWSNFLLMVVDTLATDLTAEQTLEREAVIETARKITAIWEEMQARGDDTTASSTPPGLHIGDFYTAEKRCKVNFTDEASRKRDQSIHPWNYLAGEGCTGQVAEYSPLQPAVPSPVLAAPSPEW